VNRKYPGQEATHHFRDFTKKRHTKGWSGEQKYLPHKKRGRGNKRGYANHEKQVGGEKRRHKGWVSVGQSWMILSMSPTGANRNGEARVS